MNINKVLLAMALGLPLTACTDARMASYSALGDEASVKCYSGGQLIFEDTSTGKVIVSKAGTPIYKSKTTGKYVRLFADCIILTV